MLLPWNKNCIETGNVSFVDTFHRVWLCLLRTLGTCSNANTQMCIICSDFCFRSLSLLYFSWVINFYLNMLYIYMFPQLFAIYSQTILIKAIVWNQLDRQRVNPNTISMFFFLSKWLLCLCAYTNSKCPSVIVTANFMCQLFIC